MPMTRIPDQYHGPRKKGRVRLRDLRVGQDFRTLQTRRPGTVSGRHPEYITVLLESPTDCEWRETRLAPEVEVEAF